MSTEIYMFDDDYNAVQQNINEEYIPWYKEIDTFPKLQVLGICKKQDIITMDAIKDFKVLISILSPRGLDEYYNQNYYLLSSKHPLFVIEPKQSLSILAEEHIPEKYVDAVIVGSYFIPDNVLIEPTAKLEVQSFMDTAPRYNQDLTT